MRRFIGVTLVAVALGSLCAPAAAAIRITEIKFDPPGKDTGKNRHLNKEHIVIDNTGRKRVSLDGWMLKDRGGNNLYEFEDIAIGRNTTLTLQTGKGPEESATACNGRCHYYVFIHWGLEHYAWDNGGDRATLFRRNGNVVDRCRYGKRAERRKIC